MTQIASRFSGVTLINTFTVLEGKADELIRVLDEATDTIMRHQPGFRHVVNYAQWKSKENFEAMRQNPAAQEHIKKAAALAQHFEPVLYTVRSVHD